ncbi:chloride channel protein [Rhodopirellula halodulae]|uniref:chloride channel protein n=1 Tax=Rhodopirellula halodulae TaxID=2894198 RepID=UPI001E52C7DB|nr:chloride channel protein [Rhodopirellula sp. JC737]MCC9656388.1 chloride channel protein [Rhodopirellula sp. JC737]
MNTIRKYLEAFGQSSGRWIVLATIVGVMAGLGAIVFDRLGRLVVRYVMVPLSGYAPMEAAGEEAVTLPPDSVFSPWMLVLVMTLGGLVSGMIVHFFAPEAEGSGADAVIDAFHNKRGKIRARIPWVKTIASAITLGTGGSGGREGPISQVSAGLGALLADRLNLSPRDRRILMAAGMGAGVGAIFKAPLAGAVFAAEILYSDADMEADVIVPSATASIVAYSLFTQSLPPEIRFLPLFGDTLHHTLTSPLELLPYSLLAVAVTLVGLVYVKLFYQTRDGFRKLPLWPHVKPAIGAALAGLVGIGLFRSLGNDANVLGVLGTGYGTLQVALTEASQLGIPMLLLIVFVKIATTALTIGSGGSGGVFGPSMVIGGCLGAAIGLGFQSLFPSVVTQPEAYAVVGTAGFFAGVARAPISTIIMVRALTGDFGLLVPTMLVTTLTFVMCSRWRLYHSQVPTRMDSKAHRGDFIIDVLEGLKVGDVFDPKRKVILIPEATTLDEIVHCLADNQQHYFPVIDHQKRIVGIFSDDDVRTYLFNDSIWRLAVAADVMTTKLVSVTPDDDLNTALKRFTSLNLEELPVIDADEPGKFLGMLRRKETISAYNRRLMEHKQTAAES